MKYENGGVGAYVKELLMEVIGTTADGFPTGHSYKAVVDKAKERFPQSSVNFKHVGWYCTKMRENGTQPPVYRERSKWQ